MPRPAHAQLGFVAVLGILAVVIVGIVIRVDAGNGPVGFDLWWHDLLAANRVPALDAVALALNRVGGTLVMTLVTAAVVAALALAKKWAAAISVGATVAVGSAICSLIKLGIGRPRPPGATIDTVSDSFPSGHVTTAAAFTAAVVLSNPRLWAWLLSALWIGAMALSRTYLLVHWASDVIAGAILGLSVAVLVHAIVSETSRILRERSPGDPAIPG